MASAAGAVMSAIACGTLEGVGSGGGSTDGPETGTGATDASSDPDVDVDADASVAPPRRPPEGTYVYQATGSDQIQGTFQFAPASYGPTATITIAHDGADCFAMTFQLRTDYTETMHFCVRGLEFVEDTETRFQKFALGSTAQTNEKCVPGDVYFSTARTLGTWPHDCTGQNTDDKTDASSFRTAGTYVYLENANLAVMGHAVLTRHFNDTRQVTGAQTGSNTSDWWFSAEDGTLARFTRKIDVDYASGFGKVTYVESVDMTLSSTDAGAD